MLKDGGASAPLTPAGAGGVTEDSDTPLAAPDAERAGGCDGPGSGDARSGARRDAAAGGVLARERMARPQSRGEGRGGIAAATTK